MNYCMSASRIAASSPDKFSRLSYLANFLQTLYLRDSQAPVTLCLYPSCSRTHGRKSFPEIMRKGKRDFWVGQDADKILRVKQLDSSQWKGRSQSYIGKDGDILDKVFRMYRILFSHHRVAPKFSRNNGYWCIQSWVTFLNGHGPFSSYVFAILNMKWWKLFQTIYNVERVLVRQCCVKGLQRNFANVQTLWENFNKDSR